MEAQADAITAAAADLPKNIRATPVIHLAMRMGLILHPRNQFKDMASLERAVEVDYSPD